MGTTFGVPDAKIKLWWAVAVVVAAVTGWIGLEASAFGLLVLGGVGIVVAGSMLALTVVETAGRALFTATRNGDLRVGDVFEVAFAFVFLGGFASMPFARRVSGDTATVLPPSSLLLLVVGIGGTAGVVFARAGYGRLHGHDAASGD